MEVIFIRCLIECADKKSLCAATGLIVIWVDWIVVIISVFLLFSWMSFVILWAFFFVVIYWKQSGQFFPSYLNKQQQFWLPSLRILFYLLNIEWFCSDRQNNVIAFYFFFVFEFVCN